jgi:hypothetical protein
MGLFDFLGGNSLEKSLKKFEKLHDGNWDYIVKNGQSLGVTNGNMAVGAASAMTLGMCINQFATHYVRTQLSIHPKWTTEGNFRDMAPSLCMCISIHFRTMFRSEYPIKQRNMILGYILGENKDGPSFRSLIEDMFKNAPLESLSHHYPNETLGSLEILKSMHEDLSLKSSHEFSHQNFEQFIDNLKTSYLY